MFRCAEESGATVGVGNRMSEAGKMTWLRRQTNRWMSGKLSRLAGQDLPDNQCGFHLIHLPTWAKLPLNTERFEAESEMLMEFLAAGQRVVFAPVRVVLGKRNSHIRPIR